jgi:uncharacterized protein (TIGR00251 family)
MSKPTFKNEVLEDVLLGLVTHKKEGAVLAICVKPNAKVEVLFINEAKELCLSVAALPTQNAANERVIEIIAQIFSLPKSRVTIIGGTTSRRKRLLIKFAKER